MKVTNKYSKFNNLDPINSAKKILKEHSLVHNKASNTESEKKWSNLKYAHSVEVYNIIQKMIKVEGKLKSLSIKDKNILKASSLLHDTGRFYQVKKDRLLKFKHGAYGAKILNEKNKINNKSILFLVKHHEGCFNYKKDKFFTSLNKKEKEKLEIMLFALRDADIISISKKVMGLKSLSLIKITEFTYNIKVSDEIYNSCLEGRTFKLNLKEKNYSVYEMIFIRINLPLMLHFDFSRNIFKEMGYLKFIFKIANKLKQTTKKLNLATKKEFEELDKKLNTLKKLAKKEGLM